MIACELKAILASVPDEVEVKLWTGMVNPDGDGRAQHIVKAAHARIDTGCGHVRRFLIEAEDSTEEIVRR